MHILVMKNLFQYKMYGIHYTKTIKPIVSVATNILLNSSVRKTKQNRLMLLSICAVCGKKKSTFVKNKELSNDKFEMNKMITKFLFTGDNFISELRFSPCGLFTESCEINRKFRETSKLRHLYRNKLDKTCFAHHVANSKSKDLAKRAISNKILKNRTYEIVRKCGCDGYQRVLASMVCIFLYMKAGSVASVNEQLAEELLKPVTKNFKRKEFYARFKYNIWAAYLAEIKSLSLKNKNVKYLFCVIDVFIEYALVKLKDKKGKTVLDAFMEILNESNHEPKTS